MPLGRCNAISPDVIETAATTLRPFVITRPVTLIICTEVECADPILQAFVTHKQTGIRRGLISDRMWSTLLVSRAFERPKRPGEIYTFASRKSRNVSQVHTHSPVVWYSAYLWLTRNRFGAPRSLGRSVWYWVFAGALKFVTVSYELN